VRVAALYDIHGNLPALDAVLAEVDDDALIVVGGDVAMGPWPHETLERLRALGARVRWLRGNADRELVRPSPPREGGPPQEVGRWARARLSRDDVALLDALPPTQTLEVDSVGGVLFCNATPRDDEELLTRISPDERWLDAIGEAQERTIVCGHTHVQFDRTVGETRIVNAGSVGMPYEAEPGAYWLALGPDVEHRRTEYDVAAAAGEIAAAGWPEEWPAATPDEATELFERIARERG
jgi:predicted phosphodiesterase